MSKPTMTLREVYEDLRKHNFKISLSRLSDGIASGLYPFGSVLQVGETKRRTFQILRLDYEKWKDKVVLRKSDSPSAATLNPPTDKSNWRIISTRTYTQEDNDIMWEVIIRSWAREVPGDTDR